MQAIRVTQFGGPEVLQLTEVETPVPGPGQVCLRVHAAGVNPVDTYIRAGTYAVKPPLPYTPGLDAAGVVASVGPGVTTCRPGDRVYCGGSLSGTYAEQVLCSADQVHPLPAGTDFVAGAALGVPYATAYRALFQVGRARAPQRVLVHGASGAVGLAAVQWAAARGLTVLGTAGSEAGRRLVTEQGAATVFDHHDAQRATAIREVTAGRGPDLILEMLADVNLALDLELLAPGGLVVVVGNRGTITIDPRLLMGKEAAVRGTVLMNATAAERAEIHASLDAGLRNGTLRPVVAETRALEQAAEAHRRVIAGPHTGKLVLVPGA